MGDAEPLTADVLSIGVFSRASSISVRTLRNYHDSGLLVPAVVDHSSGYRYYGVDQLADALVIVRLRSLDVPLVDVHRILGFDTIGETYRLLGAWVARHTHPVEDQPVCERYLDIHRGGPDLNIEIRWPIRR